MGSWALFFNASVAIDPIIVRAPLPIALAADTWIHSDEQRAGYGFFIQRPRALLYHPGQQITSSPTGARTR